MGASMKENKDKIMVRNPNRYCRPHINPEIEVVWVKRGSLRVIYDTREMCLHSGEMTLILPYHLHSFIPSEDIDASVYMFSSAVYGDFAENISRDIYRICSLEMPVAQYLTFLLEDVSEETADYRTKCLFYAFADRFANGKPMNCGMPARQELAPEVLKYIFDHLDEDLDIGNIARNLGWDPRKLSSDFRGFYGIKLTDLIWNVRLERAVTLLQTTDQSISQIASVCGFGSLRNFNRLFHDKIGCTPSQCRSRYRSGL